MTVVKLPTAAPSYITVRKGSGGWAVTLVSPTLGKPLQTALYWHPDREAALEDGRQVSGRMQRPFKGRTRA